MVWMRVGWYLAMVAVTILALLPVDQLEIPGLNWWDKGQHALAFGVLSGWAFVVWPQRVGMVVFGMLAFGAAIEGAQWLVGWRVAEWADWIGDAVGVFGALGIWMLGGQTISERVKAWNS